MFLSGLTVLSSVDNLNPYLPQLTIYSIEPNFKAVTSLLIYTQYESMICVLNPNI